MTMDKRPTANPKHNIELLKEIVEKIERYPDQYDQSTWGTGRDLHVKDCQTPMCIAGWACFLSGKNPAVLGAEHIPREGARALGLPFLILPRIFYGTWPTVWKERIGLVKRFNGYSWIWPDWTNETRAQNDD